MPEEQTTKPVLTEQKTNSPRTVDVSLKEKQGRSKKWFWVILIVILILILIGVGVWVWLAKPFSKQEPSKATTSQSATSSAKPSETKERTAYAYTGSDGNVWVLNVATKGKIQITSDGSQSRYYSVGEFIDTSTFSYEICNDSNCEIWLVDLEGSQFKKSQLKKIPGSFKIYAIDRDIKTLVYSQSPYTEVTVSDLGGSKPDKRLTVNIGEVGGRGGSSYDCFKLEFSPDYSKFFLINTMNLEAAKIVIWNLSGEKLGEITGKLTTPFWIDNKTILYNNWGEGVFTYDLSKNNSSKLNGNEDWNLADVSLDRNKLSYNIGYTFQMMSGLNGDRNIYVYDMETKENKLVKSSALGGVWVGNNYLVGGKTRKCASNDTDPSCSCEAGVKCYTEVENTLVVIDLQNKTNYEAIK